MEKSLFIDDLSGGAEFKYGTGEYFCFICSNVDG